MKFLKAVRLDDSDARILADEGGAADECTYTAELAAGFPADVWITVKREPSEDGVGERYSLFKRLMIGSHKL